MTVYKRKNSTNYQYDFMCQGQRYQGTTGTPFKKAAEAFEAKIKKEAHERIELGVIKEITLEEAIINYVETVVMTKPKGDDGKLTPYNRGEIKRLEHLEDAFSSNTLVSKVATKTNIADYKRLRLKKVKMNTINLSVDKSSWLTMILKVP